MLNKFLYHRYSHPNKSLPFCRGPKQFICRRSPFLPDCTATRKECRL